MALYAAGAIATGLMTMYACAKTQLMEDIRVEKATRRSANGMARAEKEGNLSLFKVLEANARTRPLAPSIYYAPARTQETWLSTYTAVLRLATFFHAHNVKPGDVVAVDYTNKPTMIHIWLALAALGAGPAFLNYNLSGDRLLHCLRVAGVKLFIVDDEVSGEVLPIFPAIEELGIEIVVFDQDQLNIVSELPLHVPDYDTRQNTPFTLSCIFYTSGTTGFPKPAIFALYRWYGVGLMMSDYLKLGPNDRFYTSMPMYHGSASSCFIMSMFQGSCFCVGHKFSVRNFWEDVRQSEATVISYVGETCRYLLNSPPSPRDRDHSVHSAYGNGLRKDVWHAFRERFGVTNVLEFYGASEGIGSTLNYNSGPYGLGAVGRDGLLQRFLKRNSLIAIEVDSDTLQPRRNKAGFCIRAKTDQPGEFLLHIARPELFQGYYKNPSASEEKILRNVLTAGDTWFRSGDLLRQNNEGFWYFVDRMGETFRWKSENVSTMEVANVLAQFPDIADVVVYGVQLPHHEGRAGCAAIVERQGSQFDFARFFEFARASLPKFGMPLFLRITPEIQKLENNKHVKGPLVKEGVNPELVKADDVVYWLESGLSSKGYTKFTERDWKDLEAGATSL